jgi:hypothetical protein
MGYLWMRWGPQAAAAHQQGRRSLFENVAGAGCAPHSGAVWSGRQSAALGLKLAERGGKNGVVPSLCANSTSPASSNPQYQLDRSPRSNPIVSFCSEEFLLCCAPAVLIFFVAGLLYALAASAAGVGVLVLAQPAEAKIIYTKAHHLIPPNTHYNLPGER